MEFAQAAQSTSLVQPMMVVDVVKGEPRKAGDLRPFPGLYLAQLLDQPFLGKSWSDASASNSLGLRVFLLGSMHLSA